MLTLTVYDAGLSAGSKAVNYTVMSGDTIMSIASGLAAAISADPDLNNIDISATALNGAILFSSASLNTTTYQSSLSSGASETITITADSNLKSFSCNNVNEVTSINYGGATKYNAYSNKVLQSASINGATAQLSSSQMFFQNVALNGGENQIAVSATDSASLTKSNLYRQKNENEPSLTISFDENGNMLNDGIKSYEWDAADRIVKITYPGTGNTTQFAYDSHNSLAKLIEKTSDSISSIKQYVRCTYLICEERDASAILMKQFFGWGQSNSDINYYYTRDRLGSVKEMIDTSGHNQAQYDFDTWGIPKANNVTQDSDFQFCGYYIHSRSGLNLTVFRAYASSMGRWLNRDPIEEGGSVNLFKYVSNLPITHSDPLGLLCEDSKDCNAFVDCLVNNWACKKNPKDLGDLLFKERNSTLPTGQGFKPELVASGQGGAVSRHILGGAGAYLSGKNYLGRAQEFRDGVEAAIAKMQGNTRRQGENQAEVLDDQVSRDVGREAKFGYDSVNKGKSKEQAKKDLRNALRKLLCE